MNERERGIILGLLAAIDGELKEVRRMVLADELPEPTEGCQHPASAQKLVQTMGEPDRIICRACGNWLEAPGAVFT